jgi:enoyl-CoA hydratase
MDELLTSKNRHVTRLTLHREKKANALSSSLVDSLIEAVRDARLDGTRLLVLDGAGSHFCAGFDFTGYESASDGELALRFMRIEILLQEIYHAPFETMALAHGSVFGAGADILASCGHRIATPGATFLMPGLRFGVVLGTRRFASRVGQDNAREILAASRTFGVEEAHRIGFLTDVAEKVHWADIVAKAAEQCTLLSTDAARVLRNVTATDTRAEDMNALARSVATPSLRELIRVYRESRK